MQNDKQSWKSSLVDYFLILSAIIGVGFASGKEISVFFFNYGKASLIGVIVFCLLYIYLFFVIEHIKRKLKLNTYDEFNKVIFAKLSKLTNIVLLVNFIITCAGMLAGADYLFNTFFNFPNKIPSIVLSVIVFSLLIGGIGKIRMVANFIIPLMIIVLLINSFGNIKFSAINFEPLTNEKTFNAIYYALLFGVNNFVAALPVLFESRMKIKGRLFIIISIGIIILLNIFVLSSNLHASDMPMFELSINLGNLFYIIYFITIMLALFSTLMICSYNTYNILNKNGSKNFFLASVIILLNLIISNLGYNFIVKVLYVISGALSGIYVLILIIFIIIRLIKSGKEKK